MNGKKRTLSNENKTPLSKMSWHEKLLLRTLRNLGEELQVWNGREWVKSETKLDYRLAYRIKLSRVSSDDLGETILYGDGKSKWWLEKHEEDTHFIRIPTKNGEPIPGERVVEAIK